VTRTMTSEEIGDDLTDIESHATSSLLDVEAEHVSHAECEFCCMDNVECMHSNYGKALEAPIKRIMALELLLHGLVSDKAIYKRMCHEFNTKIRSKMISSGVKCNKWEWRNLKTHFDKHVRLLPRRVLGEQICMLTRLSRCNYRQADLTTVAGEELVNDQDPLDIKFVQKAVSLSGAIAKLIKEHRAYVKEDMQHTGFESVWRERQSTAANELMQVKQLVENTCLAQAPVGKGDRPSAKLLFDA